MTPTVWSLFFDGAEIPPDVARRIHVSPEMELLRNEIKRVDPSYADVLESSIEEAMHRTFDVALLDVLVSAWRHHPSLAAAVRGADDAHRVLGLGEHEVVSHHKPRGRSPQGRHADRVVALLICGSSSCSRPRPSRSTNTGR